MEDKNLNRRQVLGGMAVAAGTAGLLAAGAAPNAAAAEAPAPDLGRIAARPDHRREGQGRLHHRRLERHRPRHRPRAAREGAKVVLGNLNDKQWEEALKLFPPNDPRVATVVQDVMDRDAWEAKADEIEKKFGPVHILVNNAGVGLFTSVKDGTLKDWDWGMGVNFWGPVYGCRTFIPRMLKHGQGSHIVTTTSTDGILLGTAGIYAVSKMAVSGLMEQLRHELRATNIGTSNLVPGMTTSNLGRSESEYRPGEPEERSAAGRRAGRGQPPAVHAAAAAADLALLVAAAGSADGGPPRRRCDLSQRHVDHPGAGVRRRRESAWRCDGGIDGRVSADAEAHRRRPRPLLPHADLRAGSGASARDEEPQDRRDLKRPGQLPPEAAPFPPCRRRALWSDPC